LDRALREVRPQLVLYNAGVDVFESDKLGRLSLSYEGMRRRDTHVIRTCVDRGIPVAAVVGGGYDNDVSVLGKRHALVHRVCAQIWRERRLWERNFDEA
jgi:acetoin utilization deacetylase AcuC-like enzyme